MFFCLIWIFYFSILVDAAAVDNSTRISPDNNLDFYAYSQGAPYSVNIFDIVSVFVYINNIDAAID